MKKDMSVFLGHILESICLIETYTSSVSKPEFMGSQQIQDAVIRRLAVIGEAVKNVSPEFRGKHPDVPWRKVAGMRDVLIHDYFGVDLELTWIVIRRDLPELKQEIARIVKDLT